MHASTARDMDQLHPPHASTARYLVEEIWRENTANGTITEKDSELIYDKDTRFLLELIQNAEDNIYYRVTPTLSFTYKKGSLRVDCNEVGFTESDVRAICKIGNRTKIGHGRSAQYVGEKGIGFKSVFKVSSIVYISSRSVSFEFDRSQAVGLIAPIWAAFPELTLPGSTSFYLKLSDNCDENQIVHDIRHLDPTMLIFLRKLKHINLSIALDDGQDLVSRLPEEKDRAGVTESEIVLAFSSWNENLEDSTQSVYAFLPIRDYGFKFLIQGDFLLTANREDVQDSPWNRALREACADAFVKAAYRLNKGPERYTWIRYLPGKRIVGFFEPLRDLILEKLSKEPILEAFSGRMVAPAELTYVPKGNFSDDRRLPLTLSPMTKDS
ncbi:hypothetical protein FALBO_5349 [Fusarium albosuccineum]|uniref:Uncharacterized protein n=1 Tax=Fusarium albosuccineum TaxID=1237068 RepID=A0A8H4PCS6_9HYPO|nr:hypothetical protein FALBO_5349 [Fusarium albosuccineum]